MVITNLLHPLNSPMYSRLYAGVACPKRYKYEYTMQQQRYHVEADRVKPNHSDPRLPKTWERYINMKHTSNLPWPQPQRASYIQHRVLLSLGYEHICHLALPHARQALLYHIHPAETHWGWHKTIQFIVHPMVINISKIWWKHNMENMTNHSKPRQAFIFYPS